MFQRNLHLLTVGRIERRGTFGITGLPDFHSDGFERTPCRAPAVCVIGSRHNHYRKQSGAILVDMCLSITARDDVRSIGRIVLHRKLYFDANSEMFMLSPTRHDLIIRPHVGSTNVYFPVLSQRF